MRIIERRVKKDIKTIYLIMSGSKYCSDNDEIHGFTFDKEEADEIVMSNNADEKLLIENYGHAFFVCPVDEYMKKGA